MKRPAASKKQVPPTKKETAAAQKRYLEQTAAARKHLLALKRTGSPPTAAALNRKSTQQATHKYLKKTPAAASKHPLALKRPASAATDTLAVLKKPSASLTKGETDFQKLQQRAALVGVLKASGKIFVLHNGGNLGKGHGDKLHTAEVYTGTKRSYDFGYDETPNCGCGAAFDVDFSDEDAADADDAGGKICFSDEDGEGAEVVGGEIEAGYFEVLGIYSSKSAAQKASRVAKSHRLTKAARVAKSHRGKLVVSTVPVFGTERVTKREAVYVVKGITTGQGHGACLLGAFTNEARAQARACQVIAGVREVWGDPAYGMTPPGHEEYNASVKIGKRGGCFAVTCAAHYDYMEQDTEATVEKHTLRS